MWRVFAGLALVDPAISGLGKVFNLFNYAVSVLRESPDSARGGLVVIVIVVILAIWPDRK